MHSFEQEKNACAGAIPAFERRVWTPRKARETLHSPSGAALLCRGKTGKKRKLERNLKTNLIFSEPRIDYEEGQPGLSRCVCEMLRGPVAFGLPADMTGEFLTTRSAR